MRKIILASASPRRKELLAKIIGDDFSVIKSSYEEDNGLDMKPVDLVLYHSLQKGKYVAEDVGSGIIISADTIVVLENEVLGKPINEEDAKLMLKKISDQWVDVITGIAVIDKDNSKTFQDHEITKVKMKDMTDDEIDGYIASGEPMDKAGAFGAQEKGSVLVKKVDGCFFNVVGLPLYKLNNMLKEVGINVFE